MCDIVCVCVWFVCSCGHQKVKTTTLKQRLPTKLCCSMVGCLAGATVDHHSSRRTVPAGRTMIAI